MSQTPRAPMLLFEFVGELFQFEAREPEFADLSQLPPKIAADPVHALPEPGWDRSQAPSSLPTSARMMEAVRC